ncbi:MAG: hypothetical protein B7Z72_07570 [Gemmatimonadetes bacterium 21-71-4]|nr:MAG: hypothetical protein B7Z72_07570 [Gemmatimonadetes bacterium 21-71-4]
MSDPAHPERLAADRRWCRGASPTPAGCATRLTPRRVPARSADRAGCHSDARAPAPPRARRHRTPAPRRTGARSPRRRGHRPRRAKTVHVHALKPRGSTNGTPSQEPP